MKWSALWWWKALCRFHSPVLPTPGVLICWEVTSTDLMAPTCSPLGGDLHISDSKSLPCNWTILWSHHSENNAWSLLWVPRDMTTSWWVEVGSPFVLYWPLDLGKFSMKGSLITAGYRAVVQPPPSGYQDLLSWQQNMFQDILKFPKARSPTRTPGQCMTTPKAVWEGEGGSVLSGSKIVLCLG
jgi:hypothetical protein